MPFIKCWLSLQKKQTLIVRLFLISTQVKILRKLSITHPAACHYPTPIRPHHQRQTEQQTKYLIIF